MCENESEGEAEDGEDDDGVRERVKDVDGEFEKREEAVLAKEMVIGMEELRVLSWITSFFINNFLLFYLFVIIFY